MGEVQHLSAYIGIEGELLWDAGNDKQASDANDE